MSDHVRVYVCETCWQERNPHRAPHRLAWPQLQRCGLCGHITASGIYVRVERDPA